MTVVINPKYTKLRSFIENLPETFEGSGEMVYTARNQLKQFRVEDYDVIVKRFKRPHLINRFAYSFIRPSKAKRAYEYALRLLDLGVQSPEPIAYVVKKKSGLISYSYFISIFEKDYVDIRDLMLGNQQNPELLKQLSEYIAYFHGKGVLHLDMSPGNILYKKQNDSYEFTLIDINRMQFMPVISAEKRYKSFKRLSESETVLTEMASIYAKAARLNETEAISSINRYSFEFFNSRKFKRRR